jgi:alpha-galactosidase
MALIMPQVNRQVNSNFRFTIKLMDNTINLNGLPLRLHAESIETYPTEVLLTGSHLTIDLPRPPVRFFRHGWQSWSLSAWTNTNRLPVQQPALLHPMQTDPRYVHQRLPHGSWLAAVEFADGSVLLLGALGLESHVQLSGTRLEAWSEAGSVRWQLAYGDEATVFNGYAVRLGEIFGKSPQKPAPRLWCSWYSLYTAIDEELLGRVFAELGDLPFDVLQVDDGWQMEVGDWQANAKFPSGMAALAEKIHATGRRAGLWLAPLIAVPSSSLFRQHPQWFLRDEDGRLVSAGFNWGKPLYALDTTHPDVLAWLSGLIAQVHRWGYDYLKLDFLYAGALPGKRHVEMPREAAYRQGLEVMRQAADDAFLLACGAPILPSLGLCDALRVGPDVSGVWESRRDALLLTNPTTPAAKNAIRTTLHRLWLRPLLHTDPDVVYFASRGNSLSAAQKQMLQDLALICDFRATSDLPQWLTPIEREALQSFLQATPQIRRTGRYTFEIDGRVVDFQSALSLPQPASARDHLQAALLAWVGNQPFALRLLDKMNTKRLDQIKKHV